MLAAGLWTLFANASYSQIMSYQATPKQHHYTKAQICLHWLSAVVILWASFTGFLASCFAPDSLVRSFFDIINPQITTLFIPFFGWRLGLYLRSAPFTAWADLKLQARIAALTHLVLYLLITLTLLTGILMMPSHWALLGLIPMPVLGMFQNHLFWLHRLICMALASCICLHILAVLYHLHQGHNILQRMNFSQAGASNIQHHAVISRLNAWRQRGS